METNIMQFTNDLEGRMKDLLAAVVEEQPEMTARAGQALSVVEACIAELRDYVFRYTFRDKEEEIHFFKHRKPVFVSQHIYYYKLFRILLNEPFSGNAAASKYYREVLEDLQEFRRENQEFYRYCMANGKHFDEKYFTRGGSPWHDTSIDKRFSTGYDVTLATIVANQMVRDYLLGQLAKLNNEPSVANSTIAWTGSKASLIELIYALHAVEVFNNGAVDIKQLSTSFERFFNISLGNIYKTFQEIRLRKKSQAPFLDFMKEKLAKRISDADI